MANNQQRELFHFMCFAWRKGRRWRTLVWHVHQHEYCTFTKNVVSLLRYCRERRRIVAAAPTNLMFDSYTKVLSWKDATVSANEVEQYAWNCSGTHYAEGIVSRGVQEATLNWQKDDQVKCVVTSFNVNGNISSNALDVFYLAQSNLIANRTIAGPATLVSANSSVVRWLDASPPLIPETYTLTCVQQGQPCQAPSIFNQTVQRGVQIARIDIGETEMDMTCFVVSKNVNGEQCSRPFSVAYKPDYVALGIIAPPTDPSWMVRDGKIQINWADAVISRFVESYNVTCGSFSDIVKRGTRVVRFELPADRVYECSITAFNNVTSMGIPLSISVTALEPVFDFYSVIRPGPGGVFADVQFTGYPKETYNLTCGESWSLLSPIPFHFPAVEGSLVLCTLRMDWNGKVEVVEGGVYVPGVPEALKVVTMSFMKVEFEWTMPKTQLDPVGLLCCGKAGLACLDGTTPWGIEWSRGRGQFALFPATNYTCQVISRTTTNGRVFLQVSPGVNLTTLAQPIPRKPILELMWTNGPDLVLTTSNNLQEGVYYSPVCVAQGSPCTARPSHDVPIIQGSAGAVALKGGNYTCYYVAITLSNYVCSDPSNIDVRNVTLKYTSVKTERFETTWSLFPATYPLLWVAVYFEADLNQSILLYNQGPQSVLSTEGGLLNPISLFQLYLNGKLSELKDTSSNLVFWGYAYSGYPWVRRCFENTSNGFPWN
jgi:hypothetical protein